MCSFLKSEAIFYPDYQAVTFYSHFVINKQLIMIILKNKNYHKVLPQDVYIGRGSPLGNPFSHKTGTRAEFLVETRQEAIEQYRHWIAQKINSKDPQVCQALNSIYALARRGSVSLVCYCAPHPCHGEVIRDIIEEKVSTRRIVNHV
jgi:hypothetical protein